MLFSTPQACGSRNTHSHRIVFWRRSAAPKFRWAFDPSVQSRSLHSSKSATRAKLSSRLPVREDCTAREKSLLLYTINKLVWCEALGSTEGEYGERRTFG